MIRSLACLLIIIFSSALGASISQFTHHDLSAMSPTPGVPVLIDPLNVTGASTAFNYTYSTADIYTYNTTGFVATPSLGNSHPGTQLTWFSTINSTKDGSRIPGTAFNFTASAPAFNVDHTQDRQELNWTLTIPQSNCVSCSLVVRFNLFGNLTRGTSENFTLTPSINNTSVLPLGMTSVFLGNQTTPAYVCGLTKSSLSACAQPEVTIPVSKWVGISLRLSFRFGWNSTNEPMLGSVGELVVASIDNTLKNSSSNFITQGSDPTKVVHTAKFFPIGYNTTVPSHTWSNEVINFYYPSGYNLTQLTLNATSNPIFPSGNRAPFERTACNDQPLCTQSLIALNMSEIIPRSFVRNSAIFITATSQNSLVRLNPIASGIATTFFVPGDTLGVNVTNRPSVANAPTSLKTGRLNITFVDRQGPETPTGQAFSTTTVIGGLFNFTLPPDCGLNNLRCGQWTITATFGGGLDLGAISSSFTVDLLQMNSLSAGGSNTEVTASGTLTNSSGSASAATNGIVFAIDSGTPINNPVTNTTKNPSSTGLYISNLTLVNGVFTQGQQLIMTFTLINPTSSAFNATVTIQHEWPGSQTHGVNATFQLGPKFGLHDLPFTSGPQAYQVGLTLTPSGIHMVLTNLGTGNLENVPVTLGTDPVVSSRQHAGLFKITVTTLTGNSIVSTNSLESPPYAYVFGLPSAINRYLAYSSPFSTDTNGKFPITLKSDSILAANKLLIFALARDSRGIVLTNSPQNTGLSDSTTLQSTMDSIGPVAEGSSVTATLHLKSNSTKFTEIITVDLYLQGSGKLAEQTGISISPGTSQDVTLSFKAPSTPGQYALSISSPQYGGGPLASQSLQVTILQSNLQILIPAAIGIVAAIIILGVYLVKRQPETIETQEKTKPAGSKSKTLGSGNSPSKSLT
ncbi:MAG TPA: hypothetical protein VNA15_11760 [Candidatus Angelobacter sp.]|nr:hypothetical protein [Candidatus Angelobacter sp.]